MSQERWTPARPVSRPGVALALGSALSLTAATSAPAQPSMQAVAAPAPLLLHTVAPAQPLGGPLADPLVDADAELRGNRASRWVEDGSEYLLLEQDVQVAVGAYGFRADRAVIRIDTEQRTGQLIRHLSMYLDGVRPLRGRGPTQIEAPRLLVTASTTGIIELVTNLLQEKRSEDPLVAEARSRVEQRVAMLSRRPLDVPPQPVESPRPSRPARPPLTVQPQEPAPDEPTAPVTPAEPLPPARRRPQDVVLGPEVPLGAAPPPPTAPATAGGQRIFSGNGIIRFNADKMVIETRGTEQSPEPVLMLLGQVRVMYQDLETGRSLSLNADNALLFLSQKIEGVPQTLDADTVTGIYLEDNVIATDGDYTIRAPRVFYDLKLDKAVVLDAVMFAWDERRQVPIYIRAEQLRQESRTSWSAQQATLSTSDFAQPHFAIGAGRLTLREDSAGGQKQYRYTAQDTTLQIGSVPVFYWPKLSGTAEALPLRRIAAGYNSHNGPLLETTWDIFALAGQPAPEGVELLGQLDLQGDHGPGLGVNLNYDMPELRGYFDAYLLPIDNGEDDIGGRANEIEHDDDTRGYLRWQHRQQLQDNWELSLEAAYVSDPTFLEEFFRSEAEEAKTYETSIYLKKHEDDWAFTFLASYNVNDFIAQTPRWEARGAVTDKLPELGYYRIGTSLWDDRLTYYSETRASRVRWRFDEETAAERGFSNAQALEVLGYPAFLSWDDIADLFDAPTDYRLRFDTRHEIQAPFKAGIFDVVPYVTGRITAYDNDFEDYSGNDDNVRFWGAMGTRAHTQFSRTYEDLDNRLLDLHRLRHIVEPNFDIFLTAATMNPQDLPLYDETVEALAEGFGTKAGVRQTFQTQRGGPGRWRSVDWLIVDQSFVYRSDDADVNKPIPRLFGYRPEYSTGGSHFHTEVLWMISDTLAAAGEVIYSFESDAVDTWRTGLAMEHSPRLVSFVDYADIEPLSSRLLSYGFTYQLTPKWTMAFRHTLDLANDNNRGVELSLARKMPQWEFVIVARHDEVDDEQTVGVVLVPRGFGGTRSISAINDRLPW